MFIEDVVIPGVAHAFDACKGKAPASVRQDVHRFLLAGKAMASEDLASLASAVYLASPAQLCRDMSSMKAADRGFLIERFQAGLRLSGKGSIKVRCP